MKPTIYSFASNLGRSGALSFQAGATSLQREFEQGRVSYFRTDAYYHAPLTVLDRDRCDPLIKKCIEAKPDYEMEEFGGSWFVRADKFLQPYILNIATPAEYVFHTAKFLTEKELQEKKPKEFTEPEDMFIGLKQRLERESLANQRRILEDFKLENFFKKVSAQIKFIKNEISKNEIDLAAKKIEVDFRPMSL